MKGDGKRYTRGPERIVTFRADCDVMARFNVAITKSAMLRRDSTTAGHVLNALALWVSEMDDRALVRKLGPICRRLDEYTEGGGE